MTDAIFLPGQDTQPIHFDNVNCIGSEDRLTDCLLGSSFVEHCGHSEDAGVVCMPGDKNNCL